MGKDGGVKDGDPSCKFAERNLKNEVMKFIDIECENYEINNEEIKNKYISILEELEKRY